MLNSSVSPLKWSPIEKEKSEVLSVESQSQSQPSAPIEIPKQKKSSQLIFQSDHMLFDQEASFTKRKEQTTINNQSLDDGEIFVFEP